MSETSEKTTRIVVLGNQALNGVPVNPSSEFFEDTNRVYGIFHTTENFEEVKDFVYEVKWISVDALPESPKRVLFSCEKMVNPRKQPLKDRVCVFFELNNQENVLKEGNYRVDISVKDSVITSRCFKIVKREGIYLGYRYNKVSVDNPTLQFNGHTREIFGIYHLSEPDQSKFHIDDEEVEEEKVEKVIEGRVQWLKENSKEVEFQSPIYITNLKFDSIRFSLPKSGKEPFKPGKYVCVVHINDKEVCRANFEILKPKPDIFLGTEFSKFFMDILDNRVVFPGTTSTIRGMYKFCRTIDHEKNVAGLRWLLLRRFGSREPLKQPKVIEQVPVPSDANFDMIVFKLDMEVLDPGLYCCEIYLNQRILQKRRYFHFKPRIDVTLLPTCTDFENPEECVILPSSKNPLFYVREKAVEIRGEFRSNADFLLENSEVKVMWVKEKKVISTTIVHLQKKEGEEYFSSFGFFANFDEGGLLPGKDYEIQFSVNRETVHIQSFVVLENESFGKKMEEIVKENKIN